MCVYCHMSKKSRVGRSGLMFCLLSTKPEIVVPGSGIRYFIFEIFGKMTNYAVFLTSLLSISTKRKHCCWLNNKNGYLTNQNNSITYFEVNCKQKEIFIVLTMGSLRARTQGSFNYTCMIFILRETHTAVHEWACCLISLTALYVKISFISSIMIKSCH